MSEKKLIQVEIDADYNHKAIADAAGATRFYRLDDSLVCEGTTQDKLDDALTAYDNAPEIAARVLRELKVEYLRRRDNGLGTITVNGSSFQCGNESPNNYRDWLQEIFVLLLAEFELNNLKPKETIRDAQNNDVEVDIDYIKDIIKEVSDQHIKPLIGEYQVLKAAVSAGTPVDVGGWAIA